MTESNNRKLEELQAETIAKEKIALAMYGGSAAFSIACLLALISMNNDSWLATLSACFFAISTISYTLIVILKYRVIHKTKDLHIAHVILGEKYGEAPAKIGLCCLSLGFLSLMLIYSIVLFVVALTTIILAFKQLGKFNNKMSATIGARQTVKK